MSQTNHWPDQGGIQARADPKARVESSQRAERNVTNFPDIN
jgi:hypothetical protein